MSLFSMFSFCFFLSLVFLSVLFNFFSDSYKSLVIFFLSLLVKRGPNLVSICLMPLLIVFISPSLVVLSVFIAILSR